MLRACIRSQARCQWKPRLGPAMDVLGPWLLLAAAMLVPTLAYECDPGRSNASARAPCDGWPADATNATLCEIDLGCCWEQTATRLAGQNDCEHSHPVHFAAPIGDSFRLSHRQLHVTAVESGAGRPWTAFLSCRRSPIRRCSGLGSLGSLTRAATNRASSTPSQILGRRLTCQPWLPGQLLE